MKLFLSIILFFFVSSEYGISQTLSINYKVERDVFANIKGEQKAIEKLEYIGKFYWKNARSIFYTIPQYLKKYPDGYISVKLTDLEYVSSAIFMGQRQALSYVAYDSNLIRSRQEFTGVPTFGRNEIVPYDTLYYPWTVTEETKTIKDLLCTKAMSKDRNGKIFFEGWFALDIPVPIGIRRLINAPGLLVEGEYYNVHERYQLIDFSFDAEIPDSIFWPEEFNEPFTMQSKMFLRPRK